MGSATSLSYATYTTISNKGIRSPNQLSFMMKLPKNTEALYEGNAKDVANQMMRKEFTENLEKFSNE